MLGAHLRQQHVVGVGMDARVDGLRIHARQIAELEHELAQRRNGIERDAALDRAGLRGGVGHVEGLVVRTVGLELVGDIADEADQARGVFNRIDPTRR
ncbi:hypothetical protein D3C72_1324920 [compost metagenome]